MSGSSQKKAGKKEVSTLGDLEMGDVDDLEEELRGVQLGSYTPSSRKPIDCRPITLQLAMVQMLLDYLIFEAFTQV